MSVEFSERVVRIGVAGGKVADVVGYPLGYYGFRFATQWSRGGDFCCRPDWRYATVILIITMGFVAMAWVGIPQAICAIQAKRAGDESEEVKRRTPMYRPRSRTYRIVSIGVIVLMEAVHQIACRM